ncbi:MAG: PEGA domain-containing protein [Myxococcaceae bacterium]
MGKPLLLRGTFVLLSLALACLAGCKDKEKAPPANLITDNVKIRLDSEPQGAAIELDGKPLALTTPADLEVPRIGAPQVRLTFRGFETWSGPLEAPGTGEPMRVRLTPLVVIEVTTDPPGAEVTCDGKKVLGETPVRFEVPQGSHVLRAEKAGFLPTTATVTASGAFSKWQAKLGRAGFLEVKANLEGAAILVDGVDTGLQTPAAQVPVTVGGHVVEARLGANVSGPKKVKRVRAGETIKLSLKLADPRQVADAKLLKRIGALEAEKEKLENRLEAEQQKYIVKDASKLVKMEEKIEALETEIARLQSQIGEQP